MAHRDGDHHCRYADQHRAWQPEPNANLDSDGEAALTECVLDLKKRKRTVVMVTHRAGLVRISDYVATMRDGAMTGVQRATEFMAQQTPAVVAGGRV